MSEKNERRAPAAPRKETACGYGSCHPNWIQPCSNMKTFVAVLCVIFLLHMAFYTYFVGVMRTMEKRFGLSSSQTGILNSTNDIVNVLVIVFIGYLARAGHKPRVLSCLVFFTAVAAFLYAMPYFVFGARRIDTSNDDNHLVGNKSARQEQNICVPETSSKGENQEGCPGDDDEEVQTLYRESMIAYGIVVLGCISIGLGGSSNGTLGLTYIDENTSKSDSSVYIAVVTSMYPWGPIIGFMLAAFCTSIPEGLSDVGVPKTDPNFIGAWWLGFVIIGVLVLIFIIPLFYFPKHMPPFYEKQGEKLLEKLPETDSEDGGLWQQVKDFPPMFFKLLSNKVFWALTIAQMCNLYVVVGVLIQQPRFLEVHYHQTAAMAVTLTGASGAISGVIGTLAGGFIMRRLKLSAKGAALLCTVAGCFACLGTAIKMIMACPAVDMAGRLDPVHQSTLHLDLSCNSNCTCSQWHMQPICVGGEKTYFSPCHAGCTLYHNDTFGDCSCVDDGASITAGMCETKCDLLIPYIVAYFIITMLSLTGRVPSIILTFRVVDEDMRSFAWSVSGLVINLCTFIPGPILFGALVDSTCLVWQEACGKTGACLFYDIRQLRLLPHGVTLGVQLMGVLFSLLAVWLIIKDKRFDEDAAEDKEHNEGKLKPEKETDFNMN